MKLFLLRHAKSTWDVFENDHDRELSERGYQDAHNLAAFIESRQITFQKIFCSTSKRTRETLKILKANTSNSIKDIEYKKELYHASEFIMKDIIEGVSVKSLLIVSHNPGISDLISYLSGSQAYNFPTCVFASFDMGEKSIDEGVKTDFVVRPKDGKIVDLI